MCSLQGWWRLPFLTISSFSDVKLTRLPVQLRLQSAIGISSEKFFQLYQLRIDFLNKPHLV